jgi:hypothetical protein
MGWPHRSVRGARFSRGRRIGLLGLATDARPDMEMTEAYNPPSATIQMGQAMHTTPARTTDERPLVARFGTRCLSRIAVGPLLLAAVRTRCACPRHGGL